MKSTRILTTILIVLLGTSTISAQDKSEKRAKREEKIKAMKIGFITNELSLTEKEAQAFWPVYNDHEAAIKKLRAEHRDAKQNLKGKSVDELTDSEAEQLVESEMQMREKKLELDKAFHSKLKTVLPIKKVLKFHKAQREFKRRLLKKMRGGKGRKKHGKGPRSLDD